MEILFRLLPFAISLITTYFLVDHRWKQSEAAKIEVANLTAQVESLERQTAIARKRSVIFGVLGILVGIALTIAMFFGFPPIASLVDVFVTVGITILGVIALDIRKRPRFVQAISILFIALQSAALAIQIGLIPPLSLNPLSSIFKTPATPTFTVAPPKLIATATFSPVPISTPVPIATIRAETDRPCPLSPDSAKIEAIPLASAIEGSQSNANRIAFLDREIPIKHLFDGNEIACIASSSSGQGMLMVDDLLILLVINEDSGKRAYWVHDFSDPNFDGLGHLGIRAYRAEDISRKFTNGKNKVRCLLVDLFPNSYSSDEIWLVIWKK